MFIKLQVMAIKNPINIRSQPHPKTINDQKIVEAKDKPLKELSRRIIIKNAHTAAIFSSEN